MNQIRVVSSTEGHLFGLVGNVVVGVWRQRATQAGVDTFAKLCAELRGEGRRFGLIGAVEPAAALPAGDVRSAMSRSFAAQRQHLIGVSFVIEGTGFRSAALRSVTTGLMLLASQPYPLRIVATAEAACEWMAGQLMIAGAPPQAAASLAAGFAQMRATPPDAR